MRCFEGEIIKSLLSKPQNEIIIIVIDKLINTNFWMTQFLVFLSFAVEPNSMDRLIISNAQRYLPFDQCPSFRFYRFFSSENNNLHPNHTEQSRINGWQNEVYHIRKIEFGHFSRSHINWFFLWSDFSFPCIFNFYFKITFTWYGTADRCPFSRNKNFIRAIYGPSTIAIETTLKISDRKATLKTIHTHTAWKSRREWTFAFSPREGERENENVYKRSDFVRVRALHTCCAIIESCSHAHFPNEMELRKTKNRSAAINYSTQTNTKTIPCTAELSRLIRNPCANHIN